MNLIALALVAALAASACSFSPLTNRLTVGEDDYVVFVGEGVDGNTDLFVSLASGGTVTQLTYTGAIEMQPALSPDGAVLAFLRGRDTTAAAPRAIILMNMLNASERRIDLPAQAGMPEALGWQGDGAVLYVRTNTGTWRITPPPASPDPALVEAANTASADTALTTWLGRQRFARAMACGAGTVCVVGPSGDTTEIAPVGRGVLRWGADSVAWFEGDNLVVRGLGPGPARRLTWRRAPSNPRDATYAPAAGDL